MSNNRTALTSAARTATNNASLEILSKVGVNVVIDMTAVTATGSVVFTLQGIDPLSGQFYTIIESAAVTTVSTVVLTVYPSATEAANLAVSNGLPDNMRILATHVNAVTMTYSVGLNYMG